MLSGDPRLDPRPNDVLRTIDVITGKPGTIVVNEVKEDRVRYWEGHRWFGVLLADVEVASRRFR